MWKYTTQTVFLTSFIVTLFNYKFYNKFLRDCDLLRNYDFLRRYNRTAASVTCHMWHFRRFTLCNHELSDIRLLAIYASQLKPVVRQVHGGNLQMTRLAIIPLTVNLTAIYLCQYLPVSIPTCCIQLYVYLTINFDHFCMSGERKVYRCCLKY